LPASKDLNRIQTALARVGFEAVLVPADGTVEEFDRVAEEVHSRAMRAGAAAAVLD
jgi:hypothetical protein